MSNEDVEAQILPSSISSQQSEIQPISQLCPMSIPAEVDSPTGVGRHTYLAHASSLAEDSAAATAAGVNRHADPTDQLSTWAPQTAVTVEGTAVTTDVTMPMTFYYLPQEPPPAYTPPSPDSPFVPPANSIWTTSSSNSTAIPPVYLGTSYDFSPPPSPPPPYPDVEYHRSGRHNRRHRRRSNRRSRRTTHGTLPPPSQAPLPSKPSDYLIYSLLSIVLFCCPMGIVAMAKSVQVRRAVKKRNWVEAERFSTAARTWNAAAFVTGGIFWIMLLFFLLVFTG